MTAGTAALDRLADRIAAEGEPLVVAERPAGAGYPDGDPRLGDLVATGPRAAGAPESWAFVIEAIYEGWRAHRGRPRLLEPVDPDLVLLAGDLLYAIGLNELAGLDDLDATGLLSDLIRVGSDLLAGPDPDVAAALWPIQTVAVACGKPAGHDDRIAAVAAGSGADLTALHGWAETAAAEISAGSEFRTASKAIHLRPSSS